MTTPEKKVKDKVVKILKELGAYYFYPVTGGFGRSGVPDIVCCLNGNFIGIECKAGDNKATALQNKNLEEIQAAGGFAFVVNEDNIDALERVLRMWGS
jgi:Holliday junction resolvase